MNYRFPSLASTLLKETVFMNSPVNLDTISYIDIRVHNGKLYGYHISIIFGQTGEDCIVWKYPLDEVDQAFEDLNMLFAGDVLVVPARRIKWIESRTSLIVAQINNIEQ